MVHTRWLSFGELPKISPRIELTGDFMLVTVRKAARFAVYEETTIKQKPHHAPERKRAGKGVTWKRVQINSDEPK